MMLDHTAPTEPLLTAMDARVLVWREEIQAEESYSAIQLLSLLNIKLRDVQKLQIKYA